MTQSLILSLKTRIKSLRQTVRLAEKNGFSLVLNEDVARLDENESLFNYIEGNGIIIYDVVERNEDYPDRIVASYLTEESAMKNRSYGHSVQKRRVNL